MRVAQIILPGASAYERKSQRIDYAALAPAHEVRVMTLVEANAGGVDVAHVYASRPLSRGDFAGFTTPYISPIDLDPSRSAAFWLAVGRTRKAVPPRLLITPEMLPEAVEDRFFDYSGNLRHSGAEASKIVGTWRRPETANSIDQTRARIERFREDVIWRVFQAEPGPEDLAGVDLWVDPAVDESDRDGFVAEALVIGLQVVATRTAVNAKRLEHGRSGTLVPPRDPNEMTHAILAGLFKPEVGESKLGAARQTISRFRKRHRLRALSSIYENLIP